MSAADRRRLFLVPFAFVCLAGVIVSQGCATEYHWTRKHAAPAAAYLWRTVSRAEMYRICGQTPGAMPALGGCAFYRRDICEVYSFMAEDAARRTMSADGLTLHEHEVWNDERTVGHCAGFIHTRSER